MKNNQTTDRQSSLPLTPSLAENQLASLSMNLRSAAAMAIKQSGLSRYDIAGGISKLLGRDVSKEMLDKWTSESASDHRFPADVLTALCIVTDCIAPLNASVDPTGHTIAGPLEAKQLKLAMLFLKREHLDREIKECKAQS